MKKNDTNRSLTSFIPKPELSVIYHRINDGMEKHELTITDTDAVKPTRREIEILKHISAGDANAQIADKLNISDDTVKKHRKNLMYKLQAHNAVQLMINARLKGLI